MNLNLAGKNALVCGSSKGIGKAIATELAQLGATVTLTARSEDILKQVAAELPTPEGQQHDYMVADFSNADGLKQSIEQHIAQTQKAYSILVNNTGGPPGGAITDASTAAFLAAFEQHLLCNHTLVQALLPGMKNSGYGRIINVISTSVKQPLAGLGVSNTVRGAVANWAKTMANELGPLGITVNNVLPGATATERLTEIVNNKSNKSGQSTEEVESAMKAQVPLARFAEPHEIAAAAAFLASPAAAYISGVNLPVDGGRLKTL